MKKNLLYILIASSITWIACGDMNGTKTSKQDEKVSTAFEDKMLDIAIKRQDFATAFVAINQILLKDTTRELLKDTLFDMYYTQQNAFGLADLGQEILAKRPNDTAILEGTAAAFQSMGRMQESIVLQERLYAITGDLNLKISLASAYAQMGNYEKAKDLIADVLTNNDPALDSKTLEQPTLDNSGRSQKVKVKAYAHYALGMILYKEGKKSAAVNEAMKALEISPYFDLAAQLVNEIKYGKKKR